MITIYAGTKRITQETITDKAAKVRQLLQDADAVIIGAGAGLSNTAGIEYSGARFTENFKDFIERYGLTDMYTAGFYPFQTEEEKWAYWSRHIRMNRYDAPVGRVYEQLLELVRDKPCFVITTNVDAQFSKAGFDPMLLWMVQGDYGKLQCACGCHDKLYDNRELIMQMCERQQDCRKDMYFVQDQQWYDERARYQEFLESVKLKKVVFLELGVGYNTPTIIRYPFEQMTANWPEATLVRIGRSCAEVPARLKGKSVSIDDGIQLALDKIQEQ